MSCSCDNASQLTAINYTLGQNSLGNLTYAYDLAGRRTSMGGSLAHVNLPNAISTTAYDAGNELTQWGTATPTYDADGNMLSDGTNTYVWNARNQLASMDSGADSFEYGPFGRRVAKATILGATNYLYDGENPVQELSGTTPTANMLTGLGVDEYFTRTDSSGTANFLTDALGSTIELTDNSGNSVAQYSYEPFGNTTATGTSANPYQYTGRENDGGGLYFYRARYYSSSFNRFISEDPRGFAGSGMNFYAYVGNDPINFEDPFGLDKNQPCSAPPPRFWQRVAVGAGGVGNIILGGVAIVGGGAALEGTAGFSAYFIYNGLGQLAAGGANLYGAISGNLVQGQQYANYAAAASTVSGATTWAATGNAEFGATASDIETVGLTAGLGGAASTGDLPEGLSPDSAAYAGLGQSATNLAGVDGNAGSNVCQ